METVVKTPPPLADSILPEAERLRLERRHLEEAAYAVFHNPALGATLLDCVVERMVLVRRLPFWETERAEPVYGARGFVDPHLTVAGRGVMVAFVSNGQTYCSLQNFEGNTLKEARDVLRFAARFAKTDQLWFLRELSAFLTRHKPPP